MDLGPGDRPSDRRLQRLQFLLSGRNWRQAAPSQVGTGENQGTGPFFGGSQISAEERKRQVVESFEHPKKNKFWPWLKKRLAACDFSE